MANVLFSDASKPMRGVFRLRVRNTSGEIVDQYEDHNVIVNDAKSALAALISEGSTGKIITQFGVGVGTNTAVPTDTALTEPYINQLTGHTFPEPGVVTFNWALGYDEANDMDISEYGLICSDNSLFSRKVRRVIHKSSDLYFEGDWSIIF